jgi:hypothetical protein
VRSDMVYAIYPDVDTVWRATEQVEANLRSKVYALCTGATGLEEMIEKVNTRYLKLERYEDCV